PASIPPTTSSGTNSWRASSTPTTRRRSRPRGRARPRNEHACLLHLPRARGSEVTFAVRKRRTRPLVRRRRSPLRVDIVVASPLWTAQRSLKTLLRRAIGEAASAVSTIQGELAIVLTDDSAIRALNRDWRSPGPPPARDHHSEHGQARLLCPQRRRVALGDAAACSVI